jgi:hypothetical protein
VHLKRGWFRTVLVLHVASLKLLKGIPGSGKGYLKLYLSRQEDGVAERLVATIRQRAPRTDAVAQPEAIALETEEHTPGFETSALERETPRQRATGPIRRGLRSFLGSMYSLMVRSRVEHEVEPGTETDPALPTVIPAEKCDPKSEPDHPRRAKRGRGWLVWLVGGAILAASLFAFVLMVLQFQSSEDRGHLERERQVVLRSEYKGLVAALKLDQRGLMPNVADIFRATEADYLALEARFTKRQRHPNGHLKVTILPFRDKAVELEKRFRAQLEAVLSSSDMIQARKQLPQEGGLFPFGQEEVRIEIRHEGNWYHGKVYRGADGAAVRQTEEFDGLQLPKMYERFWVPQGWAN